MECPDYTSHQPEAQKDAGARNDESENRQHDSEDPT
jgi:hypothetical protein